MSGHVTTICNRLSLRHPQRESLQILHRVMEIARPHKDDELEAMLSAIAAEYPSVEDFERSFPNLCFALATGVGKTRLMGAFIAYLHRAHALRHFFVLAPNLTIYNKLITDFTPNTPKYVFQGIAEFAVRSPTLVTGDNFEQKPQALELFERDDVVINIFNIAKFNVRLKDARKAWRLQEYLGESYFDHLAGLDDLVLLMDEAHRYRALSSMKSIEDLQPVLGLELTATPQIESGGKPVRFKNVIYDYPLAAAMADGYVKVPAVATRADFNAAAMSAAALERLKLEDGIRVHESAKVDLEVYAQQNAVARVKPFMLVIASDTQHADELVRIIEDDSFFDGQYRGRVIQVHSGQKGSEKDENVERLLAVERPDEPTEIVVHVNMLKEGWDVTNLYTIVPLRAADSRTLVEQSIGRGLRLPYGQRTGVAAVDRLTIVAHDRFQEIVDEAKKGGYTFSVVRIGEDIPETARRTVVVPPVVDQVLGIGEAGGAEDTEGAARRSGAEGSAATRPRFDSDEERAIARETMAAIARIARDGQAVPGPSALRSKQVQHRLLADVIDALKRGQLSLYPAIDAQMTERVVEETTDIYLDYTIAIPRVIVLPLGEVRAGFNQFTLDLSGVRLQPVSETILVQHLVGDTRDAIDALAGGHEEERLEDYVVRGLIDFDDISYDQQSGVLYDLAGQVVAHLRGYLKNDDEVRNVLLFHQRQIGRLIHGQMQQHAWEEASSYEAQVSQGFSEVRPQAFAAPTNAPVRRYDVPVDNKSDIRNMLFGGFARCLYPTQKFDVDPERKFAVVLENDETVLRWFKPGKGVFHIRYSASSDYEPDFVVETKTEKLLCEPKRANQMADATVLAKARAAAAWCEHATAHELANEGKPWRYLLIPHDAIAANVTMDGLIKRFTFDATGG